MAYAMNQCWLEHVNIVTQVIQAGYWAEAPQFHISISHEMTKYILN